jgi:hypothetical protein
MIDCRLRQPCRYKRPRTSSLAPTPSPSPGPDVFLSSRAFTTGHLKEAVIEKLAPFTPDDIFSSYCQEIVPWFPVVSISTLRNQLPLTWDKAPLDVALLCLSIILFTITPPSSPEDDNNPSDFKLLYFHSKSHITSAEGFGLNSFLLVQSRILVTLFEIAHGFYPAAYISIGATVRSADALEVHIGPDKKPTREETALIWCGIFVLDRCASFDSQSRVEAWETLLSPYRYISMESGPHPSITRSRHHLLHAILEPTLYPSHDHGQDQSRPICRFARLFEASTLLDKIHDILNIPMAENPFDIKELILAIQAVNNLQTLLMGQIGDGVHLYSGGLTLCNT